MHTPNACISLACFPRFTPASAMAMASHFDYSGSHVQICPQNSGTLTDEMLDSLILAYPESEFRLHANCHVVKDVRIVADLADVGNDKLIQYFHLLAAASQRLKARGYTLHAGRRREHVSNADLVNHLIRLEDLFQCRVGVEGMYPGAGYMLDTWEDYQWLLNAGIDYALDLSHLHILSTHAGHNVTLTRELLSSVHCIEVHISQNDGLKDTHSIINRNEWWDELLPAANPESVIFVESDLRSMLPRIAGRD